MRKLVFILVPILFFGNSSTAQDSSFFIQGNLEKIDKGTIFLNIYEKDRTLRDSTTIKNGKFIFSGYVATPSFATLTMPHRDNDFFTFYIDSQPITILGRRDSLKFLSIKGSKINDDNKLLENRMENIKRWENFNSEIYENAYLHNNKHLMDSIESISHEVVAAKRKVVASFVKEYPASMRGAMAIIKNFGYYAKASDVETLYNLLSKEIKTSSKGKEIKKMVEVFSSVAIGKKAPDITQLTLDNRSISLSSLKGKYVLIDFWASWCSPCRRENPNVVAAYNRFKDKGFTVLAVSYDSKREDWARAIKEDRLEGYHISTLNGWDNPSASLYGIKAIPSNVLVNREGIIIAKNIFGKELIKKLESIFKHAGENST